MLSLLTQTPVLVFISALGYGGAALTMRAAAIATQSWHLAAIALCLGLATLAEIALLRHLNLGTAYIAVLGLETLLVVGCATLIGEGFGLRESLGAALILGGTAVLAV